jgi:hypothetical protein
MDPLNSGDLIEILWRCHHHQGNHKWRGFSSRRVVLHVCALQPLQKMYGRVTSRDLFWIWSSFERLLSLVFHSASARFLVQPCLSSDSVKPRRAFLPHFCLDMRPPASQVCFLSRDSGLRSTQICLCFLLITLLLITPN